MRSEHWYVLGHDALEIERLQLQAAVPVTSIHH
jgi:hypothetical protein